MTSKSTWPIVNDFSLENGGVFHVDITVTVIMFLYIKNNKNFNKIVDIFISSSTVIFGIFQAVVLVGYTFLAPIWGTSISCNIQPLLIVYFHCIGITSLIFIFTILTAILSSHEPKTDLQNNIIKG